MVSVVVFSRLGLYAVDLVHFIVELYIFVDIVCTVVDPLLPIVELLYTFVDLMYTVVDLLLPIVELLYFSYI